MLDRRRILLTLLAVPMPLATAAAQPWWDERARREEWERFQAEERRRRELRREAWDERRERDAWERRRREEARHEWEREHGPYRR